MKGTCIIAAAALAAVLAAGCGGSTAAPRTAADRRLCAAAKALKDHPGLYTFMTVASGGKNASAPLRADVIAIAGASAGTSKAALDAAERKLYADCGL